MKFLRFFPILVLPIFALDAFGQNETVVSPKIESLSTFKNGVAIVRVSFSVGKPGVYVWQRPPMAVHGTFWVESGLKVAVRSSTRMLPVEDGIPTVPLALQQELAGKQVTVTMKAAGAAQPATISGRVLAQPKPVPPRVWDTNFASLRGDDYSSRYGYEYSAMRFASGNLMPVLLGQLPFLVLEDEQGGRQYIGADSVASIAVREPIEKKRPEQPAAILAFEISDVPQDSSVIHVSYLARGMAWVPSYRLDVKEHDKLTIHLGAIVRNELVDISDAEVRLISGYPNIPFAHVDSPLWASGTLAGFFAQLSGKGGSGSGLAVGVQNISINSNASDPRDRERGAAPDMKEDGAAGVDMHFASIGKRTLAAGDSLSLEVASAESNCEHIVEWVVSDKRDRDGSYRSRDRDKDNADEDQPWDAIRFVNPFKFPMTTGVVTMFERGDFMSQGTSYWVNPGQRATLRTNKALTLKTEITETEDEAARKTVRVGHSDYQRRAFQTTLHMENFRDRPVKVVVRAHFAGDRLSADGKPERRLRPDGERGINQLRELEWTIPVPAKGETSIQYSHSRLMN